MKNFIFFVTFLLSTIGHVASQSGWFYQNAPQLNDLFSVYFINHNTGWTVGGDYISGRGYVFKTTNGGTNWIYLWSGLNNFLYAVRFSDQNTGWAAGCNPNHKGTIIKTTNGGANWFSQWNDTNRSTFCSIYSINQNIS